MELYTKEMKNNMESRIKETNGYKFFEDLIYDMLMEYHKLAIQMLEIGTGIVKRY